MKNYIINENTLAILPFKNNSSLVYEGNNIFIISSKPNNIIKKNCIVNGSTLEGRKRSTEIITGNSYKAPILIREDKKIIFFPTSSPRLKDVSWINFNNINKVYFDKYRNKSSILFYNYVKLDFNISLNIINNQINNSILLDYKLKKTI